ncbi:MAG: phage/plasmid primase, P4 family [Planctomycetota bacterium]
MAPPLDSALACAARGWRVFPVWPARTGRCCCPKGVNCSSPAKHPLGGLVRHGSKDATLDMEAIRSWWGQRPNANIGVRTGVESGLVVLDADAQHGGIESLRVLEQRYGALPATPTVATGGAGLHFFFAHPGDGWKIPTRSPFIDELPGIDVRADGGSVVAVGSVHVSGRRYEWKEGCRPADLEFAPAPSFILARASESPGHREGPRPAPAPPADPEDAGHHWLDKALVGAQASARNETGLWLAAQLRDAGLTQAQAEPFMRLYAQRAPERDHPYGEDEALGSLESAFTRHAREPARSLGRGPRTQGGAPAKRMRTDLGNAERLVDRFGPGIRYCFATGAWLLWDGCRWARDETGAILRCATTTVRAMYADAAKLDDADERQKLSSWAAKSEGRARIDAMVYVAQSRPGVAVTTSELDADGWALNVRNGTLDLATGTLRPHRAEDMITKLAPVRFDAEAQAPLWDKFLRRVFDGDEGLIAFLRRWSGMSMTADVREQHLPMFYGCGNNGKNVYLDTICGLMGDYAGEAPPELLTISHSREHPTEIADLMGRRLVVASETEAGARLRLQLVKRLTGNARLKARFMRRDYFEFDRTHKLVMMTNNRPRIQENTEAAWRRILLVPFNVVVPPGERDTLLTQKLKAEWPGILSWLLEGCLEWQRDGLNPPDVVLAATAEYRKSSDTLAEFLEACCFEDKSDPGLREKSQELYCSYREWCGRAKIKEREQLGYKRFGELLGAKFTKERLNRKDAKGTYYFGVGLLPRMVKEDAVEEEDRHWNF